MSIVAGSASEVEYQMLLACDLNYIQDETYGEVNCRITQQVNEVKRMLTSFIKKLTAQVENNQPSARYARSTHTNAHGQNNHMPVD